MAHGTQSSTPAYFVKLLWLKEKQPVFQVSHKVDWEYKNEECSFIEGNFESIETGSYEWEGKPRPIFKLNLVDNKEKYILNFSFTAMSRNLLNSLCGAKELGRLRIEVRGYNKDGVDKNAIKVLNNGEKAVRGYEYEATKKLVDVITNKKWDYVSSDYSALDKFFTDQFEEINKKKVIKEEVKSHTEEEAQEWLPF